MHDASAEESMRLLSFYTLFLSCRGKRNPVGSLHSGQPSEMPAANGEIVRADRQAALPSQGPTAALQNQEIYFASQESDGKQWKRKASFVADPIYQKLQPPNTRQRSRLRTMCR